MAQKIILRSVYGKVGMEYTINPCPDPVTGRQCKYVRKVDSKGDMILTDKDKNSDIFDYLVPETHKFIIKDGTELDLNDPYQEAEWECIKNCPLIASSRYEKDSNGNYKIDGNVRDRSTHPRNGVAELYVDIPGVETAARVSKVKEVYEASKLIFEDERGSEGRLQKTKLLGRDMTSAPDSDVTEYLLDLAKRNPQKIINIYKGEDATYRLLFIEAKDKHVIIRKNNLFTYGDDVILGATDDAAVTWLMNKDNKAVVELIKKEVYPELYTKKTSK